MAAPCNDRVGKGTITFACDLDTGHDGPHRAIENGPSVRERQRWAQDREAAASLAQFQGPAQTTAERYTENPTPVPLSAGRRRMHSDCMATTGCLVKQHTECPIADFDYDEHAPSKGEMPEASQSWDLPTGDGRIERTPGGAFVLHTEGRNEPVEISQQEAIKMLAPPKISQPMSFAEMPVSPTTDPMTGQPTKQREGDQVLPTVNDHPDIQSEVIADIEARRQVGIQRYGTALQPFNGRDTLRDAYEEAMDLTVYLRSLLTMKEALRPELVNAVAQAIRVVDGKHEMGAGSLAEVAVDAILDAALLFEPGPA